MVFAGSPLLGMDPAAAFPLSSTMTFPVSASPAAPVTALASRQLSGIAGAVTSDRPRCPLYRFSTAAAAETI